ncbi:hypothetical protein K438DRAFT_1819264 [Mycena galopus ATCC 62051]|nr:hypothetical protein K438DRAFT_1819264 [Mycena galopus ATCC 62051]
MFHPRASSRSIALILYLFSHLARCAVIPLPTEFGPSPSSPQGRAVVTGVQTVSNAVVSQTATGAPSTVTGLQAPKIRGTNSAGLVTTGVEVLPDQITFEFSTSTATYTFTSFSETVISGHSTLAPVTIFSTSLTLVPAPTGLSAASTAAATSNAGAIAGGVVGAAILLIGGIVLWLFLRRRRRAEVSPAPCPESPEELRDPFADINHARESWAPSVDRLQTRESNTTSTRQLYISNEVHRAREKVAELEEMSSLLLRSSTASSRGYSSRPGSGITEAEGAWTAPTNADQPVDDRLERAILEIQALNSRIRELETQRRSSWALGLSDEPPPGYSE